MTSKSLNNMETRYHVFVSSPFEPNWIRSLAQQSILLAGHVPYLYEQRTQVRPTIDAIHELIDDSQIYLLLLGHRLGSRPPDGDQTYTQMEFDYALKNPNIKKIVALYQKHTEIEIERNKITHDPEEKKNERDFWDFYENITKSKELLNNEKYVHAPWSSNATESLAARITAIIGNTSKELDKLPTPVGWIRATDINTQEELVKYLDNQIRIEIVRKFNHFDKLDDRCKIEKESKMAIARKIHKVFMPIILRNKYHIFLDSGSTIAYVAQTIGESIKTNISLDDEGKPDIEVLTNNVLAYLHLWLVSEVPCRMFPPGVVEMPYGAAYGPISDFGRDKISIENGPDYGRIQLSIADQNKILKIQKMFAERFKSIQEKLLTIGTISGIKLSQGADVPLDWGDNEEDTETKEAIMRSQGFHTGSYYHLLYKRFFYVNDHPAIICVNEQKLDGPVRVGQCDFLFDETEKWDNFLHNKPLAFCVGFHKSRMGQVKEKISKSLGFDIIKPRETMDTHQAIIAINKKFRTVIDIERE